jgi:hypothetical protein
MIPLFGRYSFVILVVNGNKEEVIIEDEKDQDEEIVYCSVHGLVVAISIGDGEEGRSNNY